MSDLSIFYEDVDLLNHNLTTTGNITATSFYGDGSNLTGIVGNVDGGSANSVYLVSQNIDGGNA